MANGIVALLQARASAAARRAGASAAFALIAAVFVLFALGGLFAALFFALEPRQGAMIAALICAAVALVVAVLAILPLLFRRRPPPPPPPSGDMLPQFVALMAKSTPSLAPRHLIVTAALVGVALVLTARSGDKK